MRITLIALLSIVSLAAPALAEQEVVVLNLPEVQRVEGKVSIAGPLPLPSTKLVTLSEEVVPPVRRSETTALVPGGLIDATGFRTAVVSLAGLVQGESQGEGTIGAVLLPDEDPVLRVFGEEAEMQLELEVSAVASPENTYFSSSEALRLGFPRYRVFYYNTTESSVSVRLYAYLAN